MKKINILFLDYDGVVNTPMWVYNELTKKCICGFNYPSDNKVNNYQAVQWISEFCQLYNYKIIVSSTWGSSPNYKECLINGGLRDGIEIIGRLDFDDKKTRGELISLYLQKHPEIDNYIIIDDESIDKTDVHKDNIIICRTDCGFMMNDFLKTEYLHMSFQK